MTDVAANETTNREIAIDLTDHAKEPEQSVTSTEADEFSGAKRAPLSWSTKIALVGVVLLFAMALFAPWVAPFDPNIGVRSDRLLPVFSGGHPLGTDGQGRDILSRVIWGARPSLLSGLIPVAVAGSIGTVLGVVAGLGTRRTNSVIMRTLDVFYAFPVVLLAIAVAAALGSGISNAIVALSLILIAPIGRIAESEVVQIRDLEFMEAAAVSGASRGSIILRHVLPNIAPAIVVYCTALIGLSIVYAAGLGFLGLGVSPPTAEWGLMVNELRSFLFSQPSISVVPAIVITITSLLFNVLGDGLRDWLDVRSAQ